MTGLSDSFQRPINYLRISVTDRCNLRCIYCMPSSGIRQMSHQDILTYEEIYTIARAAAEMGISKIRLTGGEPLVRSGLPELIRMLARIDTIDDISLTTNGILLGGYAAELKQAGLKRVNVSLETLKPDRFKSITRGSCNLSHVLEGIAREGVKVSYYRRVSWVDKERFIGLKEELYAESGRILKETKANKIEEIEGRWIAVDSVMENKLRKDTYTQFILTQITFNPEIPEETFSLQNLR